MSRARTALLIVSLAALVVIACLYTYRLEATDTLSRSTADFSALELGTRNGQITVTAAPDSMAIISVRRFAYGRDSTGAAAALAAISITDTLHNSVWRVVADVPPSSRTNGAGITAQVRPKVRLAVTATNTDVNISGLTAEIAINIANGAVTTAGTAGNVVITSTNRQVVVKAHQGPLTVSATNAPLECDLAAVTPVDTATLQTTQAKATLLLPPEASATITANTTGGDILISGFSVRYVEQTQEHVKAIIGSGAATITISTTGGDIVIRPRTSRTNL